MQNTSLGFQQSMWERGGGLLSQHKEFKKIQSSFKHKKIDQKFLIDVREQSEQSAPPFHRSKVVRNFVYYEIRH